MKKLALTLVFLLLVNVVGVLGVCALTAPTVYDGTVERTGAGSTVITVETSVKGKASTDSAYKVVGYTANNASGIQIVGNLGNAYPMALEFSFMLPTGSTGLEYKTSYTKKSDTSYTAQGHVRFFKIESGKSFGTSEKIQNNKWYHVAILYPCDDTLQATVYLNGASAGTINLEARSYTLARNGYIQSLNDDVDTIYIDNATAYINTAAATDYAGNAAAKAFNASDYATSSVTAVSNGWKFDNAEKRVYAPTGAKLSDLADAITTSGETTGTDAVRVYDSNFAEITDANAEIIGKTLVIAANEKSYSYYSILENDLDEEKGRGKNASDIVLFNNNTTITSVAGNYGKLASDDVYALTTTSGYGIHLASTFKSAQTLGTTWHHLEYSFALTEGAVLYNNIQYIVDASIVASGYGNTQVIIDKNRIRNSTGANAAVIDVEINEKQWYTLGIDISTDGTEEAGCMIYLNGEFVGKFDIPYAKGFRQPQTYTNSGKTVYIDNISMKENYTYAPLADTPSKIVADKAIAVNGKLSYVGEKPESVTTTSTSTVTRTYSADGAQYIVAAEKDAEGVERVLEYYAIDSAASDYISGGYRNAAGTSYRAIAYGKNNNAKLIVAKYADGMLSEIVSEDFVDGAAEVEAGEYIRAFVWDSYSGLVPLTSEVVFDVVK